MPSYVVIGRTPGDDLVSPKQSPLFASASREEAEVMLEKIKLAHAEYDPTNTLPGWAQAGIFYKFEIKKTPF